ALAQSALRTRESLVTILPEAGAVHGNQKTGVAVLGAQPLNVARVRSKFHRLKGRNLFPVRVRASLRHIHRRIAFPFPISAIVVSRGNTIVLYGRSLAKFSLPQWAAN